MKCLLFVVACCALLALQAEAKFDLRAYHAAKWDDCVKSVGVDKELLEKSWAGEDSSDAKVKCFYKCFGVKVGLMDEDGKVKEEFKEKLSKENPRKEELAQAISKCKEQTGENECDTAYKRYTCIRSEYGQL